MLLSLSDTEHLGTAYRARPLGSGPSILHGYRFSILHLPFGATLNTICLHLFALLVHDLISTIDHLLRGCQQRRA